MELNVCGVFASEVSLVFKDGLLDRSFFACKGSFTESHEPLVREDLDEDEVFITAGVDNEVFRSVIRRLSGFAFSLACASRLSGPISRATPAAAAAIAARMNSLRSILTS